MKIELIIVWAAIAINVTSAAYNLYCARQHIKMRNHYWGLKKIELKRLLSGHQPTE